MKLRIIGILSGVALATFSGIAEAATFSFSFTNTANGSGTGIVTGLVELPDGDFTNLPATSVQVLTNSEGFGLGEYIGNPDFNFWSVAGGQIVSVDFVSFGNSNAVPAVTCCSLGMTIFSSPVGGLSNSPDRIGFNGDAVVTFTAVPRGAPEPSSLLGFITLGGLLLGGTVRKARK